MIFKNILLFSLFILIIYIFLSLQKRKRIVNHLIPNSIAEVSRMGNNISIAGPTGTGKSTTGAGITCLLIKHIRYVMRERMDKIRIELNHINFNEVKSNFISMLEVNNDLEFIINQLAKLYCVDEEMDLYSHDFLNQNSKRKLLMQYLLYYYKLYIDNRYVYSKGYYFDRVMLKNGKLFDHNSIELTNVLKKKNFQLNIADIIFDDEKSMERGNVYSNSKDVKLSGSKEFYALLRNMFEGLTYHVVMKQEEDDQVKQERNLENSILSIFDRKTGICSFPLIRFFLKIIYKLIISPKMIYLFFKSFFVKYDIYEYWRNAPGPLRRLEYYFKRIDDLLFSLSFIRIRLFKYYSSKDYGRRQKGTYDCIVLYFPIYYCYGLINTYEYRDCAFPIFDSLRENSINNVISQGNLKKRMDQIKAIFERRE